MAQIVVIGGGLVGLTAGMLLARDGHQVTVTERDAAGPRGRAGDVWQRWDRRGVNQFRQLHFMLPRWRAVMERELPEVIAELEALGGVRTSMLGTLPLKVSMASRACRTAPIGKRSSITWGAPMRRPCPAATSRAGWPASVHPM